MLAMLTAVNTLLPTVPAMLSFPKLKDPTAKPVHTVTARWGSKPCGSWKGYEPDWHVLTIQGTGNPQEYWIQGWLPANNADGLAAETFIWRMSFDLLNDCARYDFSEAVCLEAIK